MVRSAFAPPRCARRTTLSAFRYGAADPTTRLGAGELRLRTGSVVTRFYVEPGFAQVRADVFEGGSGI